MKTHLRCLRISSFVVLTLTSASLQTGVQPLGDRSAPFASDPLGGVQTQSARPEHSGRAVQTSPPAPLQGDAATARLKETGQYDSLMQAMQAARYAVETVQAAPAMAPAGECRAGNPAQALRCRFHADGLELQPAGTKASPGKLNLRLQGYGRATLAAATVDGVSARQNRVELSRDHGAVVEWYENKAAGLEQGFTVRQAPTGDGPLRLALAAEGDLRPELETQDMTAKFVFADGQAVLRYSGLKVWDATQRELAAHLEVNGQQLALVVNDRDATYPVTLDPLIASQQAKLTAGDGAADDRFGRSVALSGDTALVGVPYDDTAVGTNAGSAYVFVRSGTNWSQQAKLSTGDGAADDWFGYGVALAGDTALVGAPLHDTTAGTDAGSAYVFVRSGTTWSQQARLTAGDGAADDSCGYGVALSGDTALVGAPGHDTAAGGGCGQRICVCAQRHQLGPAGHAHRRRRRS